MSKRQVPQTKTASFSAIMKMSVADARVAVRAYVAAAGDTGDARENLVDLMTNLFLFAHAEKMDVDQLVRSALGHYEHGILSVS